jgi:hypothetical protein
MFSVQNARIRGYGIIGAILLLAVWAVKEALGGVAVKTATHHAAPIAKKLPRSYQIDSVEHCGKFSDVVKAVRKVNRAALNNTNWAREVSLSEAKCRDCLTFVS